MDHHVVSPPPFMFHYDLPVSQAEDLAQLYNDEAFALSRRHPDRFTPMATLPLQDTETAIRELQRVVAEHGVSSVEIGASVGEKELDDPVLLPFWEAAEELGVLVFIHPERPPGRERMGPYHLFNLIGFLTETTLAAARLIFSGVIDRVPRIKLCLAHAGGMALWIQGRLDHGLSTMEVCRENIDRPPSEYLKTFHYDTLTYQPEALRYVIDTVGADRVLLGTDYPFAIADPDPLATIGGVPGLSEAERTAICGGNAARMLNISACPGRRDGHLL